MTWQSDVPPEAVRIGPGGYALAVLRGVPLAIWVFGLLGVHMLVRLVERPLAGAHRPVSPWITVLVCRGALWLMGLPVRVRGPVMSGQGAMVANHSGWLDIFVLNATGPLYFVSKAEVAGWPGIGLLAKATGTVFIRRDRREAAAQQRAFEKRLAARHRLLFFPEGTSTDNLRVQPFKTTLFGAFYSNALSPDMQVQPISVAYHPPKDAEPRYYGWWGDMEFGANLIKILATPRQGAVEVIRHEPIRVSDMADRKALARAVETSVRQGLEAAKPALAQGGA